MDGAGRNWLHSVIARTSAAIFLFLMLHASIATAAETPAPALTPSVEKTAIRRAETPRASAQNRPTATSTSGTLRVAVALILVVAMIFAAKWAGRRFLGIQIAGSGGGAVRVLSRTTLSHKQQILAIQVGRRVVVAVNGGTRVDTLTEITDPEEVAELVGQIQARRNDSAASAFASLFGRESAPYRPHADTPVPGVTSEHGDSPQEEADAPDQNENAPVDPALVEDRRREIGGLLDRVRALSQQFGAARPNPAPQPTAQQRKLTS